MWHEARKQERLIRGMIVDYRKRAERRKDFYEKIKAEPTQFLQLHGRRCKIHLDPTIASAGEGPAIMMPWQGDSSNMIDRFDVRAHLDFIPEVKNPYVPPEELEPEERQCNYERYRILAQNAFLGIGEDKFLQQLAIEEQFGVTIEEKEAQKEKLHEKKGSGAAIGYNYSDPGAQPGYSNGPETNKKVETNDSDDDSDLEIIDVDLSIDVNKMDSSQAHELNAVGPQYGMAGCDLFSYLTGDADDAEHQKQLLREEKEKAMFSGRKSRRERRAHRDKKLATRVVSPPSYAAPAPAPPAAAPRSPSRSPERSRSATPDVSGGIQFITSFGGEEEETTTPATAPAQKPLYADKLKHNLKKVDSYSEALRKNRSGSPKPSDRKFRPMGPHRPGSRSRSRSLSRSRSRSWKRSRSRSYSRSRSMSSRSRSRSRSRSPYRRSRSRSRSPARNYRNRQSRSPVNQASGYTKHNDSKTLSYESNDRSAPGGGKPALAQALPRYYGRRKEDKSSSDLSSDSDSTASSDGAKNKLAVGNKSNTNQNQLRLSGSSSKGPSRETLSLKEKLKRKMQAQLTRQLRADKRAEAERLERESRRQARRDEEMRELAIKLRRKQREMRHQQNRRSSDDSDGSRSRSSSRLSRESLTSPKRLRNSRSRSKSASPPKHIPVWETEPSTSSYRTRAEDEGHYQHPQYPARKRYPDTTDGYHNREYHNRDDRNLDHYQRKPDERSQEYHQNRYPRRDYGPRQYDRSDYAGSQGYDNRWEQEGHHSSGRRRPYGHRGGYRGHGHRSDHRPSYSEGRASNWRHDSPEHDSRQDSPDGNRNRVKLVDY